MKLPEYFKPIIFLTAILILSILVLVHYYYVFYVSHTKLITLVPSAPNKKVIVVNNSTVINISSTNLPLNIKGASTVPTASYTAYIDSKSVKGIYYTTINSKWH